MRKEIKYIYIRGNEIPNRKKGIADSGTGDWIIMQVSGDKDTLFLFVLQELTPLF